MQSRSYTFLSHRLDYCLYSLYLLALSLTNDLLELFTRDLNYISSLNETETDFQFYVVRQKYAAKMLGISDLVQPETTITVYDYIKQNLTNQMQSQALVAAVQDITKSLRTPSNFEYKQKDEKLKKLLDWDK